MSRAWRLKWMALFSNKIVDSNLIEQCYRNKDRLSFFDIIKEFDGNLTFTCCGPAGQQSRTAGTAGGCGSASHDLSQILKISSVIVETSLIKSGWSAMLYVLPFGLPSNFLWGFFRFPSCFFRVASEFLLGSFWVYISVHLPSEFLWGFFGDHSDFFGVTSALPWGCFRVASASEFRHQMWYSSLLSGHDSHFSFHIVDLTKSSPSLEREFKIHPHNSNNIIAKLASSIVGCWFWWSRTSRARPGKFGGPGPAAVDLLVRMMEKKVRRLCDKMSVPMLLNLTFGLKPRIVGCGWWVKGNMTEQREIFCTKCRTFSIQSHQFLFMSQVKAKVTVMLKHCLLQRTLISIWLRKNLVCWNNSNAQSIGQHLSGRRGGCLWV